MLNRESILAMNPGRELDALVAEHVMGIPVTEKRKKFEWVNIRLYSIDMSAAWEVLDKFIIKGAEVNVGFYETWDCDIDYPIGWNWREKGKTAPEAICKTALCALLTTLREDG